MVRLGLRLQSLAEPFSFDDAHVPSRRLLEIPRRPKRVKHFAKSFYTGRVKEYSCVRCAPLFQSSLRAIAALLIGALVCVRRWGEYLLSVCERASVSEEATPGGGPPSPTGFFMYYHLPKFFRSEQVSLRMTGLRPNTVQLAITTDSAKVFCSGGG